MSAKLSDPQLIRKIQVIALCILVGGSIFYVGLGAYHYGFDSEEGKSLWQDMRLIVVAGVLASFALIGLGRRASEDKQ